MHEQYQRRLGGADIDFDGRSSRPISLDLHTYSHQEDFVRRHMEPRNPKYDKENYACYVGAEKFNSIKRNKKNSASNIFYQQNFGGKLTRAGFDAQPVDLDEISSSSGSASGDEDDFDNDKSNDLIKARHIFYSTSDMTTSDSEICRYPTLRHSKRANALNLATSFPSLSTIYPDNNSSLSFDDCDYQKSVKLSNSRHQRHDYKKDQLKNKKLSGPMFATSLTPPPSSKPTLEMIEEISPVLPSQDSNDMDLPPMIQPLKLSKEWKPIQTSTMTDFHRQHTIRIPKTNPRHLGISSTPRHHLLNRLRQPNTGMINAPPNVLSKRCIQGIPSTGMIKVPPMVEPVALEPPTPKSLFDPYYQDLSQTCSTSSNIRPEQYNLPSQLAKQLDIKGILYLNITIIGWTMVVKVRNAAYFFKDKLSVSSFVKVEVKRNKSYRKRTKYDSRFKSYRSCVVPQTNRPDFYEEFKFRITTTHLKLGDKLGITVYATNSPETRGDDLPPREVIGRMSFSLRKLFRKASLCHDLHFVDDMPDPVKVCDGGYFLLPERTGSENHLSQDNILHQKYYDEIGSTTISTTSSMHSSPLKMMGEPEWRSHGSAFKVPSQDNPTYLPSSKLAAEHFSTSNRCNSNMVMGSPCKKSIGVDSIGYYNQEHRLGTNSSSSSHLLNLHNVFSTRFGGSNPLKKNVAPTINRDESCKIAANSVTSTTHRKNSVQNLKNDGNVINLLDYTTGSGSTSSSSGNSSGIEYKRRHRCTLPSITTTMTDTTTSDYSNGDSLENRQESLIDYHYLYANPSNGPDENENNDEKSNNDKKSKSQQQQSQQTSNNCAQSRNFLSRKEHSSQKHRRANEEKEKHVSVRRVASFTFSPEGSSAKHNKRGGVITGPAPGTSTCSSSVVPQRKFTLGPLGKTLNYLRSKVDIAISTSSLYPTKEECRLWQESFEALLNNKYGCYLFRQFVEQEFSSENLEFWLLCEEYKKLKEGKKSTIQKAQYIYNMYIKEGAIKEVNLDSVTRAGTKASLESGIRSDTFNLAQNKIEQLMAKDSYPRFLKSDYYLQVLNGSSSLSVVQDVSDSGETGNVMMRVNSANDSFSERRSCNIRRHTCVPEQSETLTIQAVVDKAK